MVNYPDFDSLPPVEGQPQGNAWGFWGKGDELGTLNLLTPEVIRNASQEIKIGKSVQLDLRLDHFDHGIAGRERFEQTIVDFQERNKGGEYEIVAHDDVVRFNTQSSSQWDGLRHVGLQSSGVYYGGMKHREIDEGGTGKLGIQSEYTDPPVRPFQTNQPGNIADWVENGGIVGRGILLDYHRWREDTGKEPAKIDSPFPMTVDELDEVARYQNLELKTGDILIIRSGFTAWHDSTPSAERAKSLDRGEFIGVEASMKSVKWLWNHHFAAVAGDSLGFEVCPAPFGNKDKVCLHEWLLTHWGCPIGELWNLEKLSKACAEAKQWSFFFTSAPLHVFGGVGTTPNAIAIL
ncbi:uncharacterized protein Z520_02968 [Fonsecaea multimorphosa CBS 102226]|uniref:Cyclase n=1 Tax=Fonsecaea multimorphosa CBS 102226 TaxID=1442371 RepID=A0A0D2HHS0_9EURO|nr:uncharacterized protein Z520_02968 [Fonsecaea multimorphosa CBS 102226]KIY01416.1 hypothetical protein Z520_02968 [Fonsecaea multimorphosa CBS 102226]OAL28434.1 hypothetical protein AYO22_02888 [Fonsecaea multimorphosa]